MKRWANQESRSLLAFTLAVDPTMMMMLRRMFRLGARNIRHDWMFVRQPDNSYVRIPDPSAWNADINEHVGVCLIRPKDSGEWFLNGQ